ncbi:MAG: 8-amino-7-oxononanoate synthase [Candidatus Binatia bacterium]
MLKDFLAIKLREVEQRGLYRRLRLIAGAQDSSVTLNEREVLLLSSNNYLGIANHPTLKRAAQQAIEQFGCSAGASRLISGHMTVHAELEAQLATFKHSEAALVFPSGYHANVGTISALVGPGDTVFSDALNHASIIDGCRLSRATVKVFRHCEVSHLAELLAQSSSSGQRLIVTDSVFSMDGDVAPLADIVTLARQYNAWVMADEAHATGVFGARGAGLAEALGLEHAIDIHMGTLGKALGGFGAYVAGSRELIEWLINRARSFIYTTGIPPAVAATAIAALNIVREEPERRRQLWENTAFLRDGLTSLGYTIGPTQSSILPVMIGDPSHTMRLATALLQRGVLAQGIRPPTVPVGTSRIRVTPMATHTHTQLANALDAFALAGKETGILP